MQFLYQREFAKPDESIEAALLRFWSSLDDSPNADARAFAEELARNCVEHLAEIDVRIQKGADNWDISRIAAIDRAILRLAL